MNRRINKREENHDQRGRFVDSPVGFVIRNTATGAYLCDRKMRRRVFSTYQAAEHETERLHLNSMSYETEIIW